MAPARAYRRFVVEFGVDEQVIHMVQESRSG